jgi:ribosome-binding factor A
MSTRKQRVEHALRDVLTDLIRNNVKDPRVNAASLLSITRVEMNVDLSVANVFVSVVPDPQLVKGAAAKRVVEKVVEGLTRSAGFLRGPAARKLNLARPPELRFVHDQSVDMHDKIAAALADDVAKAKAAAPVADDSLSATTASNPHDSE